MSDEMKEADRPSRHGAILGEALAALADAGRKLSEDLPEACATCAFRLGSMPNQMAGTGLIALNCTINVDPDDFACHHGMKGDWPTKLCVGYYAAQKVPFDEVKAIIVGVGKALDAQEGPDEIREAFDAWLAKTDPTGSMDVYQLGRAYARSMTERSAAISQGRGNG